MSGLRVTTRQGQGIILDSGAYQFPTGLLYEGRDGESYLATFFDGQRAGDSFQGWEVCMVKVETEGLAFAGEEFSIHRGTYSPDFVERLSRGEGR